MKLVDTLGFADFYRKVKDKQMPFVTAYKLSKLATRVEEEVQFYRDELTKIINEYSLKDENGNPQRTEDGEGVKLIPGKEEECGMKIVELQNVEIDVGTLLTVDELNSFSEYNINDLTPVEIQSIIPFIQE